MSCVPAPKPIQVFQKDDLPKPQQAVCHLFMALVNITKSRNIATSSFGPCYVLTGHDPIRKYSFLAHIDDMTDVGTLSAVFDKLKAL